MARIGAGLVAGLGAGVVFGTVLAAMQIPMPTGDQPSLMMAVAHALGVERLLPAWLGHLGISVVVGALFAAALGARAADPAVAVGAALALALGLWVVGALVIMPVRLGQPPFTPLRSLDGAPVAIGTLLAHLLYGATLGLLVPWLAGRGRRRPAGAPPA